MDAEKLLLCVFAGIIAVIMAVFMGLTLARGIIGFINSIRRRSRDERIQSD